MHIFQTIYDEDVFPIPDMSVVTTWTDRSTAKIVLFNEKMEIGLICNTVNPYFSLPGGGIEGDENAEQAIVRECKEETGCEVHLLDTLGVTEDYRRRNSRHCIHFGYIGRVTSYGKPDLTESEKNVGVHTQWMPLHKAATIFKNQEELLKKENIDFYNTGFNMIRDSFFIQKAMEWLATHKN